MKTQNSKFIPLEAAIARDFFRRCLRFLKKCFISIFTNRSHDRDLLLTGFVIHNSSKSKGFTLVESLVAISIVLIAIAGPLTVVAKSLSFARFARDQIVAFYLAQEAVEFIRNTRDNNILAGQSWLNGLNACASGKCAIDSSANTVTGCATSCDPLKLSPSGVYGYVNGTNTVFTREVALNEISPDQEVTIDVEIRWTQGLVQRDFTIREHVFNWQ